MMTEFTTITIDGDEYVTTKAYADAFRAIVIQAELLTLEAHPDSSTVAPLYLTDVGTRFIYVIKEHRRLTGMSLKDSKRECDRVRVGGRILLGKFDTRTAREVAKRFEEAGAKTSLPGPLFYLAQSGVDQSHWETETK
jgi:ribosomal protein L7/L12